MENEKEPHPHEFDDHRQAYLKSLAEKEQPQEAEPKRKPGRPAKVKE